MRPLGAGNAMLQRLVADSRRCQGTNAHGGDRDRWHRGAARSPWRKARRWRRASVKGMNASGFTGIPALSAHAWAYPALEVAHIVGIALLLGNLVLLELRVWGVAGELPVRALARAALGLAVAGFALVVASGLTMFAANPRELLANRAFLLKMVLVGLAGLNAAVFHARGGFGRLDGLARAQTVLSLGLWLTVIICGRWIAYL